MVPRPPPPHLIPEYFAGKEVFITGVTGFIGKVLVERLLWTCPEISRLHLLIRHKKDMGPDMRLKRLQQSQVFDVIKQNYPERMEKLCLVAGDVTKHNFGIDRESFEKLNQVSVVFHSAATVKFNEPLTVAVEQNLRSVLTLLDICDRLPMMQVLVYVSTAYCNAELSSVEERVYPAPARLQQLLALVEHLSEDTLADLTPKLISPKPNTYTFTKAMAEKALAEHAPSAAYATAIVRPSTVISSLRHPFPGWIENLNGLGAVVAGTGKGLMRVMLCDGDCRADIIPVDIVTDTLIAVAWEAGIEQSREPRVYNCTSYDNPTTWNEFRMRMNRNFCRHPFDTPLRYPFCFITKNLSVLGLAEWVLQTAPLHSIGFLCTAFGVHQGSKVSKIPKQLQALREVLAYFALREWKFSTDNVKHLRGRLAAADAVVYNLDPQSIDWDAHCVDFIKGTRKYLLRERDQDIHKAHTRMRILRAVHGVTQCLILCAVYGAAVQSIAAMLRTRRRS